MATNARRSLGQAGEEIAAQALTAAGMTILARNWRCAAGELDIVAQDVAPDYASGAAHARWLVLVEVRTRRGDRYGTARQSVLGRKEAKLRAVAQHYVQATAWAGPWRIDVVAVQMDSRGRLQAVEHIRHAVRDE
jgi:putative endonuclease